MPFWLKIILDALFEFLLRKPSPTTPPPATPPPTTPPPTTPPPNQLDPIVVELLAAHNSYRARFSVPPLSIDGRLLAAAQKHANWMASTGRFDHTGMDGSSPFDRMMAEGYRYRTAGENIAMGYRDVDAVMAGWISSPGHEANIRKPYAQVGFGVATVNGRRYWVANFATPTSGKLGADVDDSLNNLPGPLGSDQDDNLTPQQSEQSGQEIPPAV